MATTEPIPTGGAAEGAHGSASAEREPSRRGLAREVHATGASFNGLVAQADDLNIEPWDLLHLGKSYENLASKFSGTEADAIALSKWVGKEARDIVTQHERVTGKMSDEDRARAVASAFGFISAMAKTGLLSAQNYEFRGQLIAHQNSKQKLASLPSREGLEPIVFRKPGEGLVASSWRLKHLRAEADGIASQYDGLVGLFGEVLTVPEIAAQATSYRSDILNWSGNYSGTRRSSWIEARARELVENVAIQEKRYSEASDPDDIAVAVGHYENLLSQGAFDTELASNNFIE